MGSSARKSTQLLFELIEQLKLRAAGGGLGLPELARWVAEHWTEDLDYCNELAMFVANPELDFELRAELFDRIYQLGPGPGEDLLLRLLHATNHWDPMMTGVLTMIDGPSGRLRERILALSVAQHGELECCRARQRLGFL